MKKIAIIMVLFFAGIANAQVNKLVKVFNELEDSKGITTITINKAMFNMIGSFAENDEDLKDLDGIFKKMNSIKMLVVEGNTKSEPALKLKSAFDKLKLEELMTIKNDGNRVKFLTENANADVFKTLLLNIQSEDNVLYMILDGEVSSADISKLVNKESKK